LHDVAKCTVPSCWSVLSCAAAGEADRPKVAVAAMVAANRVARMMFSRADAMAKVSKDCGL
jgi:hypothetical protein